MDETMRPPVSTSEGRVDAGGRRSAGATEVGPTRADPTWSEQDRLAALEHYGILDTGREAAFDDMAALVADLFDAPIAVVNLIAADRQWFKAEVGIGTDSLPLDVSICRHAILQPGVMVVPDLREDPRFEGNPLIHVDGGLRFYAGALLETSEALPLGTLCVLDREPRPEGISERQRRALAVLASQTMAQIELRRAKDEAQATARRQSFLLALEKRLRELAAPQEIMASAAELLGRELDAGRVAYAEINENAHLIRVTQSFTQNGMPEEIGEYPLGVLGSLLDEYRTGRTVVLMDSQTDPRAHQLAASAEAQAVRVRAALDVPLVKAGRLVAILCVNHPEPRAWTPHDARLVEAVAERTWDAVERARAETELRESEARYRRIVEGAEDFAIVTLDAHGIITGWNTGAERIVGFSEAEAIGQHGEIFFTPEDRQAGAPDHEMNQAQSGGRAVDERWHIRKDGGLFWGSGLMMRLDLPGGGYLKIFRDRTAEYEGEAQLRRRSEQLQGLAEVAQAVARAPSLEATLDEVTRAARRIVGAHQGVVSLTRGPDWSQAINSVALTDKYAAWKDYAELPGGSGIYAWLCEENRPARFTQAELEAHPRWRGFGAHAKDHPPMRGWLAAPLVGRDGRNLGLIQLSDREDGSEFDEADEAMLVQLAQLASAAVEQAGAEAEVQEERTRLKLATAAGQVGIWDWDLETDRITASEHARTIFGAPEQPSFAPQEIFGVIHPEDRDRVAALSQRALDPDVRAHEPYEYRILRPDGTSRWALAQGEAVFHSRDGQPRPTRYFGTIQDVTSRRESEEAQAQAVQRLRLAVEAGRMAVWDLDAATNTVTGSPELGRLLGFPEGEPIEAEAARLRYCPGEHERISAEHAAAMARGQTSYDAEFRYQHPDLGVRWLRLRYDLVFSAEGQPVRVIGVMSDETERREAEEELRESEARFRAAVGAVQGVLWTNDASGRMVGEQPGWAALTGQSDEEYQGYGWAKAVHPDDAQPTVDAWNEAVAERRPFLFEHRVRRHDGEWRRFSVRAIPAFGSDGEIREWVGVHTDITDLRAREAELRDLNETLEARVEQALAERDRTWNNSRDLLLVVGIDGVFRAVNPAWTAVLGWSAAELVGRSYLEFILPDDHPSSQGALATAAVQELPTYENRYRHKDGGYRVISWVAAPEDEFIYASGRDVTAERERQAELEAAQEALRQSQKMEAVGQLTGGIAHDFNNMLAVVVGSLDLLGRRVGPTDARAKRYVDAAMDGARRAALLTQRLLAFSRQQPLRPEPVDANKLVAGMSDLLRHSLGGEVRLETVLAGGLWRTHADPNQLENVILNLAVNARDAMPGGGRLTIETQNAHLDSRYAAAHLGVAPGQYVLIAVTDTGSGMPEEVAAKAFDPFFTTKEVGKGTGLGLSQVYGFVKQSGGHVKIYSEPGQGTTVKVYLPRYLGAADEAADAGAPEEVPLGERQEVVLVVEDEPAVRQFSVDALTELGYQVLEADGAAAALRLLDAHPEIALLFTDVVMPEVNGAKLAQEARRRRPELRILFTTGYTRNAVVHNGTLDPGVELIGKPFTLEELAARVRAVLDGPAEPTEG